MGGGVLLSFFAARVQNSTVPIEWVGVWERERGGFNVTV